MTKFNSLARARVIGPEGGAWGGGASGGAGEGVAGVDILVVSSSPGDTLGGVDPRAGTRASPSQLRARRAVSHS